MKPTFGAPFSPECGPDSAEAHRQRGQPSAFPATSIKDRGEAQALREDTQSHSDPKLPSLFPQVLSFLILHPATPNLFSALSYPNLSLAHSLHPAITRLSCPSLYPVTYPASPLQPDTHPTSISLAPRYPPCLSPAPAKPPDSPTLLCPPPPTSTDRGHPEASKQRPGRPHQQDAAGTTERSDVAECRVQAADAYSLTHTGRRC